MIGWLTTGDKWDLLHVATLEVHADKGDVIYPRWRTGEHEFPYSPYNRIAHISGLNFVGTAVLLSPAVVGKYIESRKAGRSVDAALRDLALSGAEFFGVNMVTYTRE